MDTIRMALVGTGLAFDLHANVIAALENVSVTCCVDTDIARAEKAALRLGCAAFQTLKEALPHCDAVAICSPPATHRALAVEAMEAGKGVLVEKPMAVELVDAHAMLEVSERTGMVLMMGFNNCFRDGFLLLRDTIANGTIGKLNSFYIHRQSKGLVKEGVPTWRSGPNGTCGHAIESLSHDLSTLRFCVGEVKTVQACTLNSLPFAPDYDNTAMVAMELACGAVASLHSDWNSALAFNLRGASGSKGAISLSGSGNWELREARIRTDDMKYDEIKILNDSLDLTCYLREYTEFLAAVRGGAKPSVSAIDGLRVLELSHAILTSAATGKAVTLTQ